MNWQFWVKTVVRVKSIFPLCDLIASKTILYIIPGTINGQLLPQWLESNNYQEEKLIGWIHSHVNGADTFFSSIDVHTQHGMQATDSKSFGIVMSINAEGNTKAFDSFRLTKQGMHSVGRCSTTNLTFHNTCRNIDFYESVENVTDIINELPMTIRWSDQFEQFLENQGMHDFLRLIVHAN